MAIQTPAFQIEQALCRSSTAYGPFGEGPRTQRTELTWDAGAADENCEQPIKSVVLVFGQFDHGSRTKSRVAGANLYARSRGGARSNLHVKKDPGKHGLFSMPRATARWHAPCA
jgi:hypothetical protein